MINSVENKRLTEFDRKSQLEKGLFFRPFSGHFLTSNSRSVKVERDPLNESFLQSCRPHFVSYNRSYADPNFCPNYE